MKKPAKKVSGKRSSKRSKELAEGSIAWYEGEWKQMGKGKIPAAFVAGLAQLSYENRQIRRRLDALEAVSIAQVLGRVEIQGNLHLLSCAKREDPKEECTCGGPKVWESERN